MSSFEGRGLPSFDKVDYFKYSDVVQTSICSTYLWGSPRATILQYICHASNPALKIFYSDYLPKDAAKPQSHVRCIMNRSNSVAFTSYPLYRLSEQMVKDW